MGKMYVGIDIAKDRSSAHGIVEGGRSLFELTFDMDGAGFAELLRTIEAKGGSEGGDTAGFTDYISRVSGHDQSSY